MDAEDNQVAIAGGMENAEGGAPDQKRGDIDAEQAFNENQAATLAETKKRRKE